jgi:hypothetical protein
MQAILIGIAQLQLSNYRFSSRTSSASAESFSRLSIDAGASRLGLHLGAAAQHRADAHAPIVQSQFGAKQSRAADGDSSFL